MIIHKSKYFIILIGLFFIPSFVFAITIDVQPYTIGSHVNTAQSCANSAHDFYVYDVDNLSTDFSHAVCTVTDMGIYLDESLSAIGWYKVTEVTGGCGGLSYSSCRGTYGVGDEFDWCFDNGSSCASPTPTPSASHSFDFNNIGTSSFSGISDFIFHGVLIWMLAFGFTVSYFYFKFRRRLL